MSFREEVTVAVNLKDKGIEGTLAKLGTALTSIKASADSLEGELDQIEDSVQGFDPDVEETDIKIGAEVDLDDIQQSVTTAKMTANTFASAIGPSNIKIGAVYDQDSSFLNQLVEEVEVMNEAVEAGEPFAETKEEIAKQNKNLANSADNSVTELDRENSSFNDIIDSGDSLTEVKQKVADANKNVQKMSRESAREVAGEDDKMRNLFDSLGIVEEAMDETGDTFQGTSRAIRQMRRRTDDTSESLRAAAQVGEVFEDGLGSLSVNLGAFTIALRNFLTQVPLLLTALGALGSAALGAAAAFITLSGAIAGLAGAGALASAMAIKEEFSEIESLGESLQVIFLNLRDSFLEVVRPLTEIEGVTSFFERFVNGALFTTSVLVRLIESLTRGTEAFESLANSTAVESMYSIGDAMSDIGEKVGPQLEELAGALRFSFLVLGEETVDVFAQIVGGLANAITFSSQLLSRVDGLGDAVSNFGSTIAELAKLGKTIGGGLLPIFNTFTSVMQSLAEAFNQVSGETMQNLITVVALTAALNKLAGAASVVVTIVPNLVVGLSNVASQASAASGALATMRAATVAAATQIGTFINQASLLGGVTALISAITGADTRLRKIAFSTKAADELFGELGEEVDQTTDDLRQLAIEGKLADETLDELGEDSDFDASRFDVEEIGDGKQISVKQFLPDTPISKALFGDVEEEADETFTRLTSMGIVDLGIQDEADDAARGLKRVGPAVSNVAGKMSSLGSSVLNSAKQLMLFQARVLAIIPAMAVAAASSLKVAAAKLAETGSLKAATSAMIANVSATNSGAIGYLKYVKSSIAAIAANYGISTSAGIAAVSMKALAASIVTATGGIALLLAIVGGLAVGIITNFDKIKSSASGMFETIKALASAVADVLLTYFVTSWNIIVDVVQAVIQGLSPLTDLFTDLLSQLGLFGSAGEDGASTMDKISSAADFLKGIISGMGTVIGTLADVLGGLLTIFSTIIRIALIPITAYISGLISLFDFLIGKVFGLTGGVGGLTDALTTFFTGILDGLKTIPQTTENVVNAVIKQINRFLQKASDTVPGVDLGQIETISLTDDALKTDREELSTSTGSMIDSLKSRGDPSVTYKENNQTNVNQTVNADPEDKATLSRVVTDAMNEANSFERRIQGGQ